MIDITGINLVELAKKVYELSVPQGMGFLHYTKEPLTDEEAQALVRIDDKFHPLAMDYVKGRACKMTVYKKNGRLEIRDSWYDHTDRAYDELLKTFGITRGTQREHGCACNCIDCQSETIIEK